MHESRASRGVPSGDRLGAAAEISILLCAGLGLGAAILGEYQFEALIWNMCALLLMLTRFRKNSAPNTKVSHGGA